MQVKKEEKREAILRAAEELLFKKGVENVSMGEIASAAGVGKGTLYVYFPSKDDLLGEVALSVYESFIWDIREASGRSEEVKSFIEELSERIFRDLEKRGRLLHMLRDYLRGEVYERLQGDYKRALKEAYDRFEFSVDFEEFYFYVTSMTMSSYIFREMGKEKLKVYYKKGLEKLLLKG